MVPRHNSLIRKNHSLAPENVKNVPSPLTYRLKVYASKRKGARTRQEIVEAGRIRRKGGKIGYHNTGILWINCLL